VRQKPTIPPEQQSPHEGVLAYRPGEAAKAIGVGKTKFYDLIATGRVKAYRLGNATIIKRCDLEALLESLEAVTRSK
jgi:excisionase family DNA binding protein